MPKTESKREAKPKPKPAIRKKNESLELLRNVAKSMASAVPLASAETKATIEDSLARPIAGLSSQLMGYNEETGEVQNAAMANLRRIWNASDRRKKGLPPEKRVLPGIVTDTGSLLNILGNGPEWSQRMQDLADVTHEGVNQSMGLEEPHGFRQHALDSLGVMAGQLPVPSKAKVDAAVQGGKGALQLMKRYGKKALTSPFEFLSPTVDPKMSNYAFGAVAGGGLGALGDEVPMEEPRLPQAVARSKGGKVGALQQLLRAVSINPDARVKQTAHQMGDPVEEVLYATNEGQRRGVLTSDEAKQIKTMLETGEEDRLSEALIDLHSKLNPKAATEPTLQALPSRSQLTFETTTGYREPVHGHGKLSAEEFQRILEASGEISRNKMPERPADISPREWERIQNRMKGWKVRSVEDLKSLVPTQQTEQLRLTVPSISRWIGSVDEPVNSTKKLDILKNPKSQADVERWAGREVDKVRFMTDQDGNTYVWDADQAIHDQVLEALGLSRKGLFHEMTDTPISPEAFDYYFYSNPWE